MADAGGYMANQRDKDKRLIGAFVPSKLKRRVVAMAERDGITVSEWVKRLLVDSVNEQANSDQDDCAIVQIVTGEKPSRVSSLGRRGKRTGQTGAP